MISLRFSNLSNFCDLHTESVVNFCANRRKFNTTRLNGLISGYFSPLLSDFESLVRADVVTLEKIKSYFDALSPSSQKLIKQDLDLTSIYGYFTDKSMFFGGNAKKISYNSDYLASQIDVFTCPYCNEHYTYSVQYSKKAGSRQLRRIYDWDHVYPKAEYPFLAISFYNLVPACKPCNVLKQDQNHYYYNPHSSHNVDDIYCFDVDPIPTGYIKDANLVNVSIIIDQHALGRSAIAITLDRISHLERVNKHKNFIKDILNKKRIYFSRYGRLLERQFQQQNISVVELRETLFGIYFDEKDYYKRPFSKLTNDIFKGPFV